MTLQRMPKFEFKPEDIHINYNDDDLFIYDYLEWFGTNENANVNYERRIEELTEAIRRLNEELHRVTYVNIDYTIQPNGSR